MANFTGYPLATDKLGTTEVFGVHAAHHNTLAEAANELQVQINALAALDAALEIELRVNAGFIQWRHIATPPESWVNLVDLTSITGPAGSNGKEVEFNLSATYLQWRYVGDPTWVDLLELASIAGPTYLSGFGVNVDATTHKVSSNLITIPWAPGDDTAKLGTTIVFTDSAGDTGTDLTRSIVTTPPPNSGSAGLATPHLRLACPTGLTNANSRYFFPITGPAGDLTSVDSEVCSLWLGHTTGVTPNPQIGHGHRVYTRPSSGNTWGFVTTYDVTFGVDSLINVNVWEIDTAGHSMFLGSGMGEGGSDMTAIQKWIDVLASTKSGTTVTLLVPGNHGILVGHNLFVKTENLYDASVTVTAVDGNKITYMSGTSATIAYGGPGAHANGAGIMCRSGIMPYWVKSQLIGNLFRVKVWRYGDGEPAWDSSDYALQMTATGTYPTSAGKSGLIVGHCPTDVHYAEIGYTTGRSLDA